MFKRTGTAVASFLLVAILIMVFCVTILAAPGMIKVTFKFQPEMEGVKTVHLAGTFNGWSKTQTPMSDEDGDGIWEVTIELRPGEYQYKFVINGGEVWKADPNSEDYAPDGFGGQNSVIRVGNLEELKKKGYKGDGFIAEDAIWFDPASRQFINKLSENRLAIRFQTKKDDVTKVILHYRDQDGYHLEKMSPFAFDNSFDYWRAEINIAGKEFKYRFAVIDGKKTLWYGPDGVVEKMSGFLEYDITTQEIYQTPDWVKDAVFYQIFPDRFFNGNPDNDPELIETYKNKTERYSNITPKWYQGIENTQHHWIDPDKFSDSNNSIKPKMGWHVFYGGDLQGIEQKLSYLKELGINAIYLNPIFEATSNHRYNTMGYEFIDDNLAVKGDFKASEEYFKHFIQACHQQGIRVILDAVFNHTGYEHYAFQDVVKNGKDSRYWDWYFIKSYPIITLYEQRTEGLKPNYEAWWGFGSLPKLNVANPEVKEYLFKVTRKWMDPNGDGDPSDGVDGWRLDVANEVEDVDPDFWREWRNLVKEINPEAYIVGEIWDNAYRYLKGDKFDGVMNYRFRDALLSFIAKGKRTAVEFAAKLAKINFDYPRQALYSLQNLIGSHDTARFLTEAGGNKERLKLAALMQFTYPGAPMIYYGDEIGMQGEKDPDCRRTMIWQERPNGKKPDRDLFNYYSTLAAIRKKEIALRRGSLEYILPEEQEKVFGMRRLYEGQELIILLNAGEREVHFELPLEIENGQVTDLLSGNQINVKESLLKLDITPLNGLIIKVR